MITEELRESWNLFGELEIKILVNIFLFKSLVAHSLKVNVLVKVLPNIP